MVYLIVTLNTLITVVIIRLVHALSVGMHLSDQKLIGIRAACVDFG